MAAGVCVTNVNTRVKFSLLVRFAQKVQPFEICTLYAAKIDSWAGCKRDVGRSPRSVYRVPSPTRGTRKATLFIVIAGYAVSGAQTFTGFLFFLVCTHSMELG